LQEEEDLGMNARGLNRCSLDENTSLEYTAGNDASQARSAYGEDVSLLAKSSAAISASLLML